MKLGRTRPDAKIPNLKAKGSEPLAKNLEPKARIVIRRLKDQGYKPE